MRRASDAGSRREAEKVLRSELPSGVVERAPGSDKQESDLSVRLSVLRKVLHGLWECRTQILLSRLLYRISLRREERPMTADQLRDDMRYQAALSVAKGMLEKGLITREEYAEMDTRLLAKYRPYLGSLLSENAGLVPSSN